MEKVTEIKICIDCKQEIILTDRFKIRCYNYNFMCLLCSFKNKSTKRSKIIEYFYEMKDFYKKHIYIGPNKDLKTIFDIVYKESNKLLKIKSFKTRKQIIARKHYIRSKILKRDKYQCILCLCREKLRIHHIIPVSFDKSKELDEKNLVTLCQECHKKAHKYYWKDLDYNLMEKLANYTNAKK